MKKSFAAFLAVLMAWACIAPAIAAPPAIPPTPVTRGTIVRANGEIQPTPRWAAVGTSLINQMNLSSSGGSITYAAKSWMEWARALGCEYQFDVWWDSTVWTGWEPSGAGTSRYFWGANYGVSGQTQAQIAARIPDIIADHPDVLFLDDGTNDITTTDNFASLNAVDIQMENQLLAAGIKVVRLPILARDTACGTCSAGWASGGVGRKVVAQLNKARYERARTTRGMYWFTWNNDFIDPTSVEGNPYPNFTAEGIHFTHLSAYPVGKQLKTWGITNGLCRQPQPVITSTDDYYDQTNNTNGNMMPVVLAAASGSRPNPFMAGTTGVNGTGSSGTVATGYRVERSVGSNTTVANSIVARTDNVNGGVARGNWQRLTFTQASNTQDRFYIRTPTATTNWPAGIVSTDWVEAGVCLRTPSAYAGFKSLRLALDLTAAGGTTTGYAMNEQDNGTPGGSFPSGLLPYPNDTFEICIRTPPQQVGASTGFRIRQEIVVDNAIAGTPVLDVAGFYVRKVSDPRAMWGTGPVSQGGLPPTVH